MFYGFFSQLNKFQCFNIAKIFSSTTITIQLFETKLFYLFTLIGSYQRSWPAEKKAGGTYYKKTIGINGSYQSSKWDYGQKS